MVDSVKTTLNYTIAAIRYKHSLITMTQSGTSPCACFLLSLNQIGSEPLSLQASEKELLSTWRSITEKGVCEKRIL
jgi:hypothetical protein